MAAPALPTFGHYIAYGLVLAVTPSGGGVDCSGYARPGEKPLGQFELNTVSNVPTEQYRVVIEDTVFHKSAHSTIASQTGTVSIFLNGARQPITPTYTATLTPIDPNSFTAAVPIAGLPANGTGTCTQTESIAFVRSSAD